MMNDPAMTRFLALQLARVAGVVLAAVGVLLWQTPSFGYPQPAPGKALFALGLFLTLVIPALLRRRWRTPNRSNP